MDSFDVMMVALRFNQKINQRDLDSLTKLMTDDHLFIDNSGDVDKNVKEGWRQFFENHLLAFSFRSLHSAIQHRS